MSEVAHLPKWLDKRTLATELSCGVRTIERMMALGMPHRHMLGKAKFSLEDVESWLEEHGQSERRGEAA